MRLSILSVRGCSIVQQPDGMRVETVSESVGTGPYAFVPSTRWQEGKETVAGMVGVGKNHLGLSPAVLAVKVLYGWKLSPCNALH